MKKLTNAVSILEYPSFMIKVADIVGTPIEKAIEMLPSKAQQTIGSAAQKAIHGALKLSLKTISIDEQLEDGLPESSNWWHMSAVATSGAVGGFFGIAAIAAELPISTIIIMRSIADIARSEGADLNDIQSQLECVQVLALGGASKSDDAAEIGYFVAREAMAKAVAEAAAYIAKNGLEKEGAPAIVRLIIQIAERYSITVSEKAAAQAVPVIGAIGGALINTLFIDHFQDMAKAHFAISNLEKKYGQDDIKARYIEIRKILRDSRG